MAVSAPEFAGNWLQLAQDSLHGTYNEEYIMVLDRKVVRGHSASDKTDVAIFWDKDFLDKVSLFIAI